MKTSHAIETKEDKEKTTET